MKRSSRAAFFSCGLPIGVMAALSGAAWSGCSAELGPGDESRAIAGELGVISQPSVEICDGLDNDNDGEVDESDPDLGIPCDMGLLGVCGPGSFVCKDGNFVCESNQQPQVEDCHTPEDEDCDGYGACSGGEHVWSRAFQGAGQQTGNSMALDGAGHVFVAANFGDTVDFGTGPLTATGGWDPAILKLDANGNTVWARHFATTGYGHTSTVVVKPSGNLIVAGYYSEFADFGMGTVRSMNDGNDYFVVELTPNGNTVWARTFGSAMNDRLLNAVVDASGNTYLTGEAYQNIDFGTGLLSGLKDGFLVKLDPTGNTLWAKRFAGAGESFTSASLVMPSGDVLVTARVWLGSIDFGNGPISTTGAYDAFIARFDPAGNVQDVHHYGGASAQMINTIALDSAGNLIVAGIFGGTLNLGAGPLTAAYDGTDGFIAKLDSSYNVLWQKRLSGPKDQDTHAIVDAADNVIGVSTFNGTIDFGAGPISSASSKSADVYVVKYSPAGHLLWNKTFGDAAYQYPNGAITDGSGNIFFTGGFTGSIGFGGATFTNTHPSDYDMHVVKLGP